MYQPTRKAKIKQIETTKDWQEFGVIKILIDGCKIISSTSMMMGNCHY